MGRAVKNSLEIVIKQVRLEGGFKRGRRIRVVECLRQIVVPVPLWVWSSSPGQLGSAQSPVEIKRKGGSELGSSRELDSPLLQLFLNSRFSDTVFVTLYRPDITVMVDWA